MTVKNLGSHTIMKVHELCYTGRLTDTPMVCVHVLCGGYTPTDVTLPKVQDCYVAKGCIRQLSEVNLPT